MGTESKEPVEFYSTIWLEKRGQYSCLFVVTTISNQTCLGAFLCIGTKYRSLLLLLTTRTCDRTRNSNMRTAGGKCNSLDLSLIEFKYSSHPFLTALEIERSNVLRRQLFSHLVPMAPHSITHNPVISFRILSNIEETLIESVWFTCTLDV